MPVILGGNTGINLASFPTGIVTSDLVLYLDAGNPMSYSGSGSTWMDISGYNNNATLINSPTFDSLNQGSILFNGTTQRATIADNVLFKNNTNMSISFWTNFSSIATGTYSIINKGKQEDKNIFWLWYQSAPGIQRLVWEVGSDLINNIQLFYNWVPVIGTWYNITCTFEPNLVKIYINASLVASASTTTSSIPANSADVFSIASYRGSLAYFFSGKLNLGLFYRKTLSITEIINNFNVTRNRYGV